MNATQLDDVKKIEEALFLIRNAKVALIAIGDMMQPDNNEADEQLNLVFRSQSASIFQFFGNALEAPVRAAANAMDRLELAAMKVGQHE